MVASQARPAYIYDTTLGDWVPMSGVVDTGQAYTFTANQTFNGLVNANNGINAATTLSLQTGGVNRMSIDSSGRITLPYQPGFASTRAGAPVTSAGNVVYDTVFFNTGNHYNSSTGVFTAPISGKYLFSFHGMSNNAATGWLELRRNGTRVYGINPYNEHAFTNPSYKHVSVTAVVDCAANDQINVYCQTTMYSGGNNHNNFFGQLVG
jgi:hypothetical protein